jgi:uncharacterized membrane protein SirB2
VYFIVKNIHLATVAITYGLFFLRGVWMILDSPRLNDRWARILPHVNDTILLMAGLWLAVLIGQYPFVHDWLTAKFFSLIAYIVLGTMALKRGKKKGTRIAAWLAAQIALFYMVLVALTRQPLPL